MATDAIDDELARALGATVGTHSHEDLPASRIDELDELTTAVAEALEDDSHSQGATLLLEFWTGHVAQQVGVESTPDVGGTGTDLFEEGFEAGAIGVDLYQALSKVATALQSDGTSPDLAGWTERLFELTTRHVAHLESHQQTT
ncbi:MAG: hypothetical protein ABEJ84_08410 [Halodesulfurarchaeum sp.]